MTAGQNVYIDVTWISPNAQYFMENVTTGSYATYYQTTSHHDTTSAEAIFEDASVASGATTYYTASGYNSLTFDDVSVYDLNHNGYTMDTTTYDKFWMGYTGVCFMGPSALSSPGVFSVSVAC